MQKKLPRLRQWKKEWSEKERSGEQEKEREKKKHTDKPLFRAATVNFVTRLAILCR